MRVFNFSAGPAVLPEPVLEKAAAEMLDWHGTGMSVMEMSHRGKAFVGIAAKAEADLRALLAIPADYKVLFLQGGAIAENAIVPMNLLGERKAADYVNTGEWSKKSIKEAKKYCTVNVAASAEDENFTYVPPQSAWKRSDDPAYVHVCTNETIGGVEYQWTPIRARSRWSPTCPRTSFRASSTSRSTASSTAARRRTSARRGSRS
jgi:phosphoserine aminotransferase